jgi:hypothetical protein
MKGRDLRRTADISLAALFGALIAFSYFIPVSIMIGGVGVFNLTWIIQTMAGILLGPCIGGGAAATGGLIGELLIPSQFGPLGFVRPTLAAVQAGLIVWGRWKVAAIILGFLILLWFLLPVGLIVWPMAIFHIIGLVVIMAFGRSLSLAIRESRAKRKTFMSWLLIAYCADITRHLFGNIWLALLLLPPYYFWLALPATAIEQSIFALASAVIGVSTLIAIEKTGFDIPLTRLCQLPEPASP